MSVAGVPIIKTGSQDVYWCKREAWLVLVVPQQQYAPLFWSPAGSYFQSLDNGTCAHSNIAQRLALCVLVTASSVGNIHQIERPTPMGGGGGVDIELGA